MKRLLILLILALAVLSVQMPVLGAKLPVIDDLCDYAWDDAQEVAGSAALLDSGGYTGDLTSLEVEPGEELRIYLNASLFADEDGRQVGDDSDGVTLSQLRTGRITVGTQSMRGADLIDTVELDYDKNASRAGLSLREGSSYIKVAFAEHLVSVESADFSVTIQLKVRGKARSETQFTVSGTMENPRLDVLAGDDYLNLEEGVVAWPQANVRDCRIHLGGGFQITSSLNQGQKYYGVALVTDEGDLPVRQAYPTIAMTYEILQQNLSPVGNICSFDLPAAYQVYGEDGTHLGTTGEELPFSNRYYLSDGELENFQQYIADLG